MDHSKNTLKVLLWKHVLVRKRRFINTAVELIAPLVIFIILFCIRGFFQNIPASTATSNELTTYNTEQILLQPRFSTIYYTPETPLTQQLINKVEAKLREFGPVNIKPVNDTKVAEYIRNSYSAFVIFENVKEESGVPDKLDYTIRVSEDFLTGITNPQDGIFGPHPHFGFQYTNFVGLQWVIDSSFIELKSTQPITQKVLIQEFPYVVSKGDMNEFIIEILKVSTVALFLPFIFLFSRLLDERSTGVQELMKMMGVSPNILGLAHFLNCLPTMLVYAIGGAILLKVSGNPVLPETNFVLIAVTLALHFCSVLSMGFAASYIVQNLNHSTTIASFTFLILMVPSKLVDGKAMNRFLLHLTGIFPHTPMLWFWTEVEAQELYGQGVTFLTMFTHHSKFSAAVWFAMIMLLFQICLFLSLTWYLDKVRPGNYGVALPWYFLFQKQYWSVQKVFPDILEDDEQMVHSEDACYFEDPPQDADVGIKVVNVSKIYGTGKKAKTAALSRVSLNIYKGEITVLVGHNGAGKTTLMSIIAGMTSATEGNVYVNGLDSVKDQHAVRRDLGLCPQHNLAFSNITVLEHILFFSMLKGKSYSESKASAKEWISQLKLEGKEDSQSNTLSGGMKRRLQLACALAGGSSVLLLDEPTSGLDVETRRQLWDMLLSLRGSRTVLLTTHFMEEADALGDRVAAIHAGKLRSFATPMFLKRAIGTGYRLSLTLNKSAEEMAITNAIHEDVPDAILSDHTATTLTYKLPAHCSDKFPKLFNQLEQNRKQYGVETIGVGVTTLEEVFLKLCSDMEIGDSEAVCNGHGDAAETTFNKMSGLLLYIRIIIVLFSRQIKATLSTKWQFLSMQCIVPIILICIFTATCNNSELEAPTNIPVVMNPDLYQNGMSSAMLIDIDHDEVFSKLSAAYPKVQFVRSNDVIKDIINIGKEDKLEYNKYIGGLKLINTTHLIVYYTTIVRHAVPVTMNLLSNIVAMETLPAADAKSITVKNFPRDGGNEIKEDVIEPKESFTAYTWAIIISFLILSILSNEVNLPCKERSNGSRHAQLMSGCPPPLYWLVTTLYDFLLYITFTIVPILLACIIFDKDSTFARKDFLVSLFVFLLVGGLAVLMFVYFVSFFFAMRIAGLVLIAVAFAFGIIAPVVTLGAAEASQTGIVYNVISFFGLFVPAFPFTDGVMKMMQTARFNALCQLNKSKCPRLVTFENKFDVVFCCASTSEWGPFDYYKYSNEGSDFLLLIIHMLVYAILVLLLEYGIWSFIVERIVNMKYRPIMHKYNDQFITDEAKYVQSKFKAVPTEDAALIHNLHKKYFNMFRKSVDAVRGINFSIKKGECFGLLGVNGAGKSTTFKMMTIEEAVTKGDVYATGNYLSKNRFKYLYGLGYCPQFGGVDKFMTGRENLRLLLTIRGLSRDDVEREVTAWLQCVGLERYADKHVAGYSGGCARRLAAASALAAGAALCVLDEPTAGVDVSARRRVWAALRRGLARRTSVLVTSHSMDEMEALCSRIAILSEGEVCALGSAASLRSAHAKGFALRLKLRPSGDEGGDVTDSSNYLAHPIDSLKGEIQRHLETELKDEHKTMLHYRITSKIAYSELFRFLENLKQSHGRLLEDYSVTETTLEEVFLSFAKPQKDSLPKDLV